MNPVSGDRPGIGPTGCEQGPNAAPSPAPGYGHPAANLFRKHEKSSTFKAGAVVLPSQLAKGSPAAKRFRKHPKSRTLRIGEVVEPSQLG